VDAAKVSSLRKGDKLVYKFSLAPLPFYCASSRFEINKLIWVVKDKHFFCINIKDVELYVEPENKPEENYQMNMSGKKCRFIAEGYFNEGEEVQSYIWLFFAEAYPSRQRKVEVLHLSH